MRGLRVKGALPEKVSNMLISVQGNQTFRAKLVKGFFEFGVALRHFRLFQVPSKSAAE
jgi:hypothetical protein